MSPERGSVAIWMLGLAVLLLLFGGLAVDFWRGLALQRELAAIADSAAIAAGSGLDEEHYRATGEMILDPARVDGLGAAAVAAQGRTSVATQFVTAADGSSVTVTVSDTLNLGLFGIFVDESEPLVVRATATAEPVLVP